MFAVAIVGLVTAFVVLLWRDADEIRRARLEMEMERAVAEERALSAEMRVKAAEARAKWAELRLEELLRKSSPVGDDHGTSQKPPTRPPSAAQ